jgi:UrcA family protein
MRLRHPLDSVRAVPLPNSRRATISSQNHLRPIRVIAAITALACGTGFVAAAPPTRSHVPSRAVRFAHLNLASEKDVATLYHRIQWAARLVCLDATFMSDPSRVRKLELCIDATVERAIGDVNRPPLTALHRSKTRHVAGGFFTESYR